MIVIARKPARPRPWMLVVGALLGGAPAVGQCLIAELPPEPGFPVPAGLQMTQSGFAAQVAPPGSAPGEAELFRLWVQPASLEVLRIDATGVVTPFQVLRLRSTASAPAVTEALVLAVDEDWLAVSMRDRDYSSGTNLNQGRVVMYHRIAGQWTLTQLLDPSGTQVSFGSSLALEGDRLLVGDRGADTVHVFDRIAAGWMESAVVPDPAVGSLVLSGDRFAVGRPGPGSAPSARGARLYDRDPAGAWALTASFLPPSGAHPMSFGASIALEGDTLVLADGSYIGHPVSVGAAFVYTRNATGWALHEVLHQPPNWGTSFGSAIVLEGPDLIVGAAYRGLVRYSLAGGTWVSSAEFGPNSHVDAVDAYIVQNRVFTETFEGGVQLVPWTPQGTIVQGCSPYVNSSGGAVVMTTPRVPSASGPPFELRVAFPSEDPGVNGFFLAGSTSAQLPVGGGELCVGGMLARIRLSGPPSTFVGWTFIDLQVDPALYPGLIYPGATVHFQYWYPDSLSHPLGNFSNSLLVTYCP